jgi:hypothetical protein
MSNSVNLAATDKQLLKRYLEIPQPDDRVLATYVSFRIKISIFFTQLILIRFGLTVAVKICVQKQ